MIISMIAAHGNNLELGLNNKMLWHVPEDFKNFKKLTSGHNVFMGRKTYESIGKPLPNRTSLVLSSKEINAHGVFTFTNIPSVIKHAENAGETELFVIGGGRVYEQLMPLVDKLYISEVDFIGKADTYFPYTNLNEWEKIEEVTHEKVGDTPSWVYKVYKRKAK